MIASLYFYDNFVSSFYIMDVGDAWGFRVSKKKVFWNWHAYVFFWVKFLEISIWEFCPKNWRGFAEREDYCRTFDLPSISSYDLPKFQIFELTISKFFNLFINLTLSNDISIFQDECITIKSKKLLLIAFHWKFIDVKIFAIFDRQTFPHHFTKLYE